MVKINLLPKEAQKQAGAIGQLILFSFIILVALGVDVIGWIYLNNRIDSLEEDKARLEARLRELDELVKEIDQFKAQKEELTRKLEAIRSLEKDQKIPVRLLDEIYTTLESELWLTAFNKVGEKLSISGVALSNPVIAKYLRNLDTSPYIKNVELNVVNESKVGERPVRNFQITAELEMPSQTPTDGAPTQ